MTAPTIPVWPWRPNWKTNVLERLEWLTDVLAGNNGVEQRRALRLSPRRSFEYEILLTSEDRTTFELFMSHYGASDYVLPLWHDVARLTAEVAMASNTLPVNTSNREFEVGGYAFVKGPDVFSYDVLEIAGISANELTLADPTGRAWPKGTHVMPTRRARLDEQPNLSRRTSEVISGIVRLSTVGANDWSGDDSGFQLYRGSYVLTDPPNWSENLAHAFERLLQTSDNQTGIPYRYDLAARSFATWEHRWLLHRRTGHADFRDWLYALQGRYKSVWIPTFAEDLKLKAAALTGSTELEIKFVGWEQFGGIKPDKRDISIELRDGTIMRRRVLGFADSPPAGSEIIQLDLALVADVSPANVRRISFIELCRMDSDAVEIAHRTDSDGASTVSAVFRSYADGRSEDTDNAFPIPDADMTSPPSTSKIRSYIPTALAGGGVISLTVAAPDWNNGVLYGMTIGNSGEAGIRIFNLSGGYQTGGKTRDDMFPGAPAHEGYMQGPLVYGADGMLYTPTNPGNAGRLAKINPISLTVVEQFGVPSGSLESNANCLASTVEACHVRAGAKDFWCSVPTFGGTVDVIDTDEMEWVGNIERFADSDYGTLVPGSQTNVSADVFTLSRSFYGTDRHEPIQLGKVVLPANLLTGVSSEDIGPPITPADIDPTWTHFNNFFGMFYDHTDGNVMFLVNINAPAAWSNSATYDIAATGNSVGERNTARGSDGHDYRSLTDDNVGNDPTLGPSSDWLDLGLATYTDGQWNLVKLDTETGAVLWSTPVEFGYESIGIAVGQHTRLTRGRMAVYGKNSGPVMAMTFVDTSNGEVISETFVPGVDGGAQYYNDAQGLFISYGGLIAGGGAPTPVPPTDGSFSNRWWSFDPPCDGCGTC